MAQELLDAGSYANHRSGADEDGSPAVRPLHHWNDALWGHADHSLPESLLRPECSA